MQGHDFGVKDVDQSCYW